MKENRKELFGQLAVFVATLIWGSTFFIFKTALDSAPMYFILAVRFSIGTVLIALVSWKKLKTITRHTLLMGACMGVFLFLAYVFQTMGLALTEPSKNAFMTAVYCVIVPFLAWVFLKKRPDRFNVISAFVCLMGIGFVSFDGGIGNINKGDLLTLVGGILFACHIVATTKATEKSQIMPLVVLQFGTAAVLCWIAHLVTGEQVVAIGAQDWLAILYLAVFGTGVALTLQGWGQKYVAPTKVAIILSLESVFGVVFSILFYGEVVTGQAVIGFVLIFVAIIIAETKLSFLRRNSKENQTSRQE